MFQDAVFALWFLLPAGLANVAPIFTAVIPGLRRFDTPIDGGRTFRGRRILGDHKTWRGIASGIVLATATVWLQTVAYEHFAWARFAGNGINYATLPILILGPLFAIGALGGDALESFFKRRRGIRAGRPWFVFDQLDYIVGAIIATLPVVRADPIQYAWMVVVWFVIHLAASYVGWLIRLKKTPI